MATAEIKDLNGAPAVFIDGVPFPFTQAITVRTHSENGLLFDKEYFRALGRVGIRIFYVTCDTDWCEKDSIEKFRTECEMLLDAVPDAYIMVRIGLHPPVSFTEKYPEECFTYDDGSAPPVVLANETFVKKYPHLYSMSSSVWRENAKKALSESCDKIDAMPFADRIIGFFFAAGGTSEWYYLLDLESNGRCGDYSAAFRRAISAYLQEKYGTDENLCAAWRDGDAGISKPKIPALSERFFAKQFDLLYQGDYEMEDDELSRAASNGTNIGSFLDVNKHAAVLDFYRAWHIATAKSQVFFAKEIKKRYYGTKLTGAFYGSYGCTDFFNSSTAGGVLEILDSGEIDFLAAPGVYVNRQPGGFCGQREMFDSFSLRNKMFIVEEDTRTHLESEHFRAMFDCYDAEDAVNILKRDFGRNLCENHAAWWYDHHVGGGRYKCEEIYRLFARQAEIAKQALSLSDRRKGNEIALIYDEESIHVISNQSTKELVEYFRNYEIARIGAGCDQYFHNDLSNPAMPDYKLYIFFNTLVLTAAEREAIHKKLSKNNAVALWVYASGVIDMQAQERFSVKNIEKLTGIRMKADFGKHHTKYKICESENGIFSRLKSDKIYGVNDRPAASNILVAVKNIETFAAPLFYADDPEAETLAKFLTNGLPALSYKQTEKFRSVFCGSKILNADIVREIARFAGCHIWSEINDVLYVSDRYLCIHASRTGEKTVHFKRKSSLFELYEQKTYAEGAWEAHFIMYKGETKTFVIEEGTR